jgi:hypothetical protein
LKRAKGFKNSRVLSLCVCALLWLNGFVFADRLTPVPSDSVFDVAAKGLDKAKQEVQDLKDKWDKTRLETTLYDQRAKRAYQRWLKAAQKTKDQAKAQKEKADLELLLAIEKRKLAYNQWQEALLRELAKESEVKALDQEKDTKAIREKIKQLEEKIGPSKAGDSH